MNHMNAIGLMDAIVWIRMTEIGAQRSLEILVLTGRIHHTLKSRVCRETSAAIQLDLGYHGATLMRKIGSHVSLSATVS